MPLEKFEVITAQKFQRLWIQPWSGRRTTIRTREVISTTALLA